ncbi:hypothetical protein Ancab_030736 [Ancistrocladus abbreviatus]
MSRGVMAAQMGGWGVMEEGWRKGPWTAEEDRVLIEYVKLHGEGRWNSVSRVTGLRRNGKSCRLRWVNYLRPDLKRGQITPQEESIILELHARWGNRWSTIARNLPGRTDNEIKNYWRTHFKKKTKTSSNNSEKFKTRLLRRQQFQLQQLQQQQPQQQQQQQQQEEDNQTDMQKIMSLLEGSEYRVLPIIPQVRNEMVAAVYPTIITTPTTTSTIEEQGLVYSMMCSETSIPEGSDDDGILWAGLWNLDDIQAQLELYDNVCNKQS